MNVKEAVTLAKRHVGDLFADEGAKNLGLEEVEFDDTPRMWNVTIGFSRPWDEPRNTIAAIAGDAFPRRVYKIVRINDDTGQVIAVKTHQVKS